MATIFSDNTTRTNSTNIGGWYTELSGSFEIVSNEIKLITHSASDDVVTYDRPLATVVAADYEVQVDALFTGGGGGGAGVAARVANISNYYMVEASPSGGNLDLYRKVSGSYTYLGGYSASIVADVFYTVKLTVTGTSIKAYLNGTERISVTDSNLTAAGKPAIRGFSNNNGQRYTNFLVSGTITENLGASLAAYWKMDEASGTRYDVLGLSNLTDNNSVGQATGKVGSAGQFNASSSRYLSVADNSSVSLGDIDCSFVLWFYLDSKTPANGQRFLSKDDTSTNREYLIGYEKTPDRLVFYVWGSVSGGNIKVVTANLFGSPSLSTWYFLYCHHDSVNNTMQISVNDGLLDVLSTSTGIYDGSASLLVGSLNASSQFVDGRIDEIGIWKRILTTNEVTQLYNSGNGLSYPFNDPKKPIHLNQSVTRSNSY